MHKLNIWRCLKAFKTTKLLLPLYSSCSSNEGSHNGLLAPNSSWSPLGPIAKWSPHHSSDGGPGSLGIWSLAASPGSAYSTWRSFAMVSLLCLSPTMASLRKDLLRSQRSSWMRLFAGLKRALTLRLSEVLTKYEPWKDRSSPRHWPVYGPRGPVTLGAFRIAVLNLPLALLLH